MDAEAKLGAARFTVRWRGYDRNEVDALLELEDPQALLDRAKQLAADVVAEAYQRANAIEQRAHADEDPWQGLGRQVEAVLERAEREAEAHVIAARATAADLLSIARADAERLRAEASTARDEAHAHAQEAELALAQALERADRAAAARRADAEAELRSLVAASLDVIGEHPGSIAGAMVRATAAFERLVALLDDRAEAPIPLRAVTTRPRTIRAGTAR